MSDLEQCKSIRLVLFGSMVMAACWALDSKEIEPAIYVIIQTIAFILLSLAIEYHK